MTCTVCGRAANGINGSVPRHTSHALCVEHAEWWSEALVERTIASDWDAEGDLRDDAHDALIAEMREDHEASLVSVMTDPLDGLSLYGECPHCGCEFGFVDDLVTAGAT